MSPLIRAVRQRFSVIVSIALLIVVALTFLTGFISSSLDLNRFILHRYAAYATIAIAAIHVVLHWKLLIAQVKRWLLPGGRPEGARERIAPGRAKPAGAAAATTVAAPARETPQRATRAEPARASGGADSPRWCSARPPGSASGAGGAG
jgi:hypothetical protein